MTRATALGVVSVSLLASVAGAGPLTPGNLVVYRVGTGATALSANGQAAFFDEFSVSGALLQSISLPTAASGSNRTYAANGTANAEGHLVRSRDGRFLTVAGYEVALGAATNTSTSNRVIARLDLSGNVDTSTAIATTYNAANIRSVATDDGSSFWTTGSSGGIQYTTFGSSGPATQVSTAPGNGNGRALNIFGNDLWVGAANSGFNGVGPVSPSFPTSAGATAAPIPGVAGTGFSAHDFFVADLDANVPGIDTIYFGDDSATNLGLNKFTFDGTTWSFAWRIAVPSATPSGNPTSVRHLTGVVDPSGAVTIFATTGGPGTAENSANRLVMLTDVGATSTWMTLATAAPNTVFRGVEFAPIPAPGALALLGLGGMLAARRRRA